MKLLSRTLIALLVLSGIAFLVMQSRADAAAKKKCTGTIPVTFGLDANGCENAQPLGVEEADMDEVLRRAKIGPECYRIHTYANHNPKPYRGTLPLVDCVNKERSKTQKVKMFQPNGNGQTQRVMLTAAMKDAFDEQVAVARKKFKKK